MNNTRLQIWGQWEDEKFVKFSSIFEAMKKPMKVIKYKTPRQLS